MSAPTMTLEELLATVVLRKTWHHERCVEVRAAAGVSQKEIANVLGTSAAAVSRYETGERAPSVEYLGVIAKMAEAIGFSE